MNPIGFFKKRQDGIIAFLKELVLRESPSSDKKAVDACSRYFKEALKEFPLKTRRIIQKHIGDLYHFELSGTARPSPPPILILTHIDTVWPVGKLQDMPFRVEGDKIYGPGVLDMKSGLTMAFSVFQAMFEQNLRPRRTIRLLVNSAEETGDRQAHAVIREESKRAGYVLCLEPAVPGGALKVRRKGRLVIRLKTAGREAHAGSPEKGVNAIEELVLQLERILKLRTGGISVSPGIIGGGEKTNVVPGKAWALLDIRFWESRQERDILEFFQNLSPAHKEAGVFFSVESSTPPMEFTPLSRRLFEKAENIASGLGISLIPGETGGGSDASIASALGIPAIDGLGPDGEGIHAVNEHVLLPSLIERTALLLRLLLEL